MGVDRDQDAGRRPGEVPRHRPGADLRRALDHPAGLDLLRADAPDLRADHRHHRRRPLGHGPDGPLHRRRQADAREQPVPGARRRGGPLGGPALQGDGPGQDQPRRRAGQPGDRDRAGDPAGARRRELVGAPPRSKILAGSLRDLRLPDAVIVDNDRLAEALSRGKLGRAARGWARRSIGGSSAASSR